MKRGFHRRARAAHAPDQTPDQTSDQAEEGTTVLVRIDALAPGGEAVGRQEGGEAEGRATFVPFAAPGERVLVRLTRQKERVAWGELLSVEQPSEQRVVPPCVLFGRCGGCQWQHVTLQAQRAAKRAIVARALGLSVAEVELVAPVPEIGAADGRGYRERAQLVVGAGGEIGFRARRSHDVVEVQSCLLLAPALQEVVTLLATAEERLPPGTEIDLQLGREGVHVALRAGERPERARQQGRGAGSPVLLANGLPQVWRAAGVVGVSVMVTGPLGQHPPERTFGLADVDIAGGEGDGEGGAEGGAGPLRIRAGDFSQVGGAANRALTEVVLAQVGETPGAVLELYAGSGNFTRSLVGRSGRVVACEGDRRAVERGRRNAPGAFWSQQPPAVVDADTVLVDPPREGLDAENLRAAAQARRRIIYVSCDPQTQGRDAVRLRQLGFELRRAVALDLMPHTYHVEVVATFEKNPDRTS